MQTARIVRAVASRRCFSTAAAAGSAATPLSAIKRVGVIGAGQMGQGIGVVAAVHAKKQVLMVDLNADVLARSSAFIRTLLEKDVKKGKMTAEECEAALARFATSTNMDALAEADFVVEAASENVDLKKKIFTTISRQ